MPNEPAIPSTVETVTTEPLVCNAYSIDNLTVDGKARDQGAWPLSFTVCPYAKGDPATSPPTANRYATAVETYATKDANAAALNMAQAGYFATAQALTLIKDRAAIEWYLFRESRRPALIAATTAADAAKTEAAAKRQAVADADAARDAAFKALNAARQDETATDEQRQALLEAFHAADAAWEAAKIAAREADAAATLASERQAIAQAAVDDPANPPLAD